MRQFRKSAIEKGEVLGTANVSVTVIDFSKAKVKIRKPTATTLRNGMDSLYLHAAAENTPEGAAKISWKVTDENGTVYRDDEIAECGMEGHPTGCCPLYLEGMKPGTVKISAELVDNYYGLPLKYNGKEIKDSIEIKVVNPGFFDRLIDWILRLFGAKLGNDYYE